MYYLEEILEITKGKALGNFKNLKIEKICTDTRKSLKNSLFIPLKGKNFDGHDFIGDAYKKGAIASLTEKNEFKGFENLILVKDTLTSYGEIAKDFVIRNNIKTIAITGTSGKTTVKEILSFLTNFQAPEKSFNNLVGVPATILNKGQKDNFLILEFGTNKKGEIERLTEIGLPQFVILTNIGFAHLEGFKDFQEYIEEKISIIKKATLLKKAIVNWDNPYIRENLKNYDKKKIIKVSSKEILDFKSDDCGATFKIGEYSIKSKLFGFHNAFNFLLCFHLCKELGFNLKEIVEKFEFFTPISMRFEKIQSKKGFFIINDCYNANFESFKASFDTFKNFKKKGKKIAVLGDILELGNFSEKIHRQLGILINSTDIDEVIGFGENIKFTIEMINNNRKKQIFNSKSKLIEYLNNNLKKDDYVLFKASRKIGLEEIIEEIK